MKSLTNLCLVFILCFIAFSCSENSVEPQKNLDSGFPALDQQILRGIDNAPDESGIVFRVDNWLGWHESDVKSGLTAFHGLNTAKFCAGDFDEAFPLIPVQGILIPNTEDRFVVLQQGVVYTEVFEGYLGNPFEIFPSGAEICDFIENAKFVGSGEVKIIGPDNNFVGAEANLNNAWSFNFKGEIEDESGNSMLLDANYAYHWDEENEKPDPKSIKIKVK
jgi:hypothetical protein